MSCLLKYKQRFFILMGLLLPMSVFAGGPPVKSEMDNPLAITLVCVSIGLLLAIGGLAYVVLSAAQLFVLKYKEEQKATGAGTAGKVLSVLVLCLATGLLHAQDAAADAATTAPVSTQIAGMSQVSFYTLVSVIALELVVILALLFNLKVLLGRQKAAVAVSEVQEEKVPAWKTWWSKMNSFRSMKEEAALELNHDYDGIRELDNKLPPWWLYGFYLTIFVAIVYIWRFHVSNSAPLSQEEYAIEMEKAEAAKAIYLAKAANNVDESTVKLLTDDASLEGGKKIFTTVCAACHSADGGGGVGPNLTDDYWLHGGNVKDVFKTIKYGWPEKGMKSWKEDYSPVQIAQLASYVKSLHGTKPATPKEPQGELFSESNESGAAAPAAKDSAAVSLR
ncbi:cytochrome c oxidase cbb3-type subunit 3 [Filimonas lacunae]|uniref:Cytochrome c oxidase cbb3-type subunit 3 n=1 Tax=Filimonas lacunae TaxID=477680 RepID=A0A173MNL9_9BACT|nr:cbb3-type cytochrome c oxidase N-terminal domain-containing protein [Filimonas lacunae]BAV09232.1 cytochrome c oxidase subunit CcoP [Filimonas lacunae]SIS69439.1 cytochrome c oxidase cbb3-type subunit 3 [Filimonas lacunae]